MSGYSEETAAHVRALIGDALGQPVAARSSSKPKRMTRAKAERLIAALAVCMECEDVEGSAAIAFERARAEVERWT